MNYGQCHDYLQKLQVLGIKLGLGNITTLLAALDNPHRQYPSVLVAGTNGKGSVCAMLAKVLSLHGYRVGLYTSPHLVKVEEVLAARAKALDEKVNVPGPIMTKGGAVESGEMVLSDYIRAIILNERISKALQDWTEGLKRRALIERIPEG